MEIRRTKSKNIAVPVHRWSTGGVGLRGGHDREDVGPRAIARGVHALHLESIGVTRQERHRAIREHGLPGVVQRGGLKALKDIRKRYVEIHCNTFL